MAFDYGKKRIGVAVGQTVSRTAMALKVVPADQGNPQWMQITSLIDEWAPDMIIVGLPAHADGQAHTLQTEIERFQRRLNGRYNLPVEFVDERLSSFAAADDPTSQGGELDAGAAKMILLTWLEQRSTQTSGNAR